MDLLQKLNSILDSLGAPMVATVIGLALEAALRLFKSDKPRSLLLAAGKILHGLAGVSEKLAGLLDKVIPQKLS